MRRLTGMRLKISSRLGAERGLPFPIAMSGTRDHATDARLPLFANYWLYENPHSPIRRVCSAGLIDCHSCQVYRRQISNTDFFTIELTSLWILKDL